MSIFERYLTLWVALCIVAGVALGHLMPGFFEAVAAAEVAKVNLPVAVLIWLMIVPMLLKIDFGALGEVREHWRGIGVTLFTGRSSRSRWRCSERSLSDTSLRRCCQRGKFRHTSPA
jgi:ACR3 family arsenite efflux pump ArsB